MTEPSYTEPSYAYNESAMMASIEAYKVEKREAAKKLLTEIDDHLRAIRASLLPVPKHLEREVKRIQAMRPQSWCRVPTILARRSISDSKSLPRGARVCCDAVCVEWNMEIEKLTRVSNEREIVRARSEAMYLMVRVVGMSLPKTGKCLGGMDHSTVLWGVRKIERLRIVDAELNCRIERLESFVNTQLHVGRAA